LVESCRLKEAGACKQAYMGAKKQRPVGSEGGRCR
jgi:hypothetical protein